MKSFFIITLLCCAVLVFGQCDKTPQKTSAVEPFMAELMTQFPNVRDLAISPDGKEVYFTVQDYARMIYVLVYVTNENGKWSEPTVPAFSGRFKDMEPAFSPDGLKLFFVSQRPLDSAGSEPKDYDIWYVEREKPGAPWSQPINVGAPINTNELNEFYPSLTASGDMYYTTRIKKDDGKEGIWVSRLVDGKYTAPVLLSDPVNAGVTVFNSYVAPDESYLIFSAYGREDDMGGGDLYISYRNEDGSWSMSQNMGAPINTAGIDYCPFVDVKSNTLYFTAKRNSINNTFAEPQKLNALLGEMNKYENGLSRIYQVDAKKFLNR